MIGIVVPKFRENIEKRSKENDMHTQKPGSAHVHVKVFGVKIVNTFVKKNLFNSMTKLSCSCEDFALQFDSIYSKNYFFIHMNMYRTRLELTEIYLHSPVQYSVSSSTSMV